jgi:hypothetical protein
MSQLSGSGVDNKPFNQEDPLSPQAGAQPESDDGTEPEVIQAVAVLSSVRALEPVRVGPPPLVQAAAAVATGFVAGAATAAVLTRRRSTRNALASPRTPRQLQASRDGATQTFLVHVQALGRRS